jgi:hypothetical protein
MSADRFLPPVKFHGANLAGVFIDVGNLEPSYGVGFHAARSERAGSPSVEFKENDCPSDCPFSLGSKEAPRRRSQELSQILKAPDRIRTCDLRFRRGVTCEGSESSDRLLAYSTRWSGAHGPTPGLPSLRSRRPRGRPGSDVRSHPQRGVLAARLAVGR